LQWGKGRPFEQPPGIRISRSLEALIEQCNWEVEQVEEAA
jgi:hypothetical protein